MIVVMKPHASEQQVQHVVDLVREYGLTDHVIRGTDRTAWCSAWMLEVALAAGADLGDKHPNAAAISWRRVGVEIPLDSARAGDVVVLSRPGAADWQRHVGLFCRYVTRTQILVLGGNQANRSGFKRFPATRLQNVRRLVSQ